MNRKLLLAALAAVCLFNSTAWAQTGVVPDVFVSGTLSTVGDSKSVALAGRQGVGFSIGAGIVGTITPYFSFDEGATYVTDLSNPPFIIPLTGVSVSGALAVPGGATHAELYLTAVTSGSSAVKLVATEKGGPARAVASSALAAATATVISAGAAQSATGNFVAIPVDPTRWASAVFSFTAAAFNGTLTWDVMINGQWYTVGLVSATQPVVGAPYATLTSTAAGNPSTAGTIAYTTTAADAWEMPLPGNATQVRVRCSLWTSGSVTVTVAPGRPYVAGVPVTAVLYDVTSATATALDSGTIDVGGWSLAEVSVLGSGSTNGSLQINEVDEAGTSIGTFGGGGGTITGTTPITVVYGPGTNSSVSNFGSSVYGFGFLPKRLRLQSGAVTAQTSRLRMLATRR